MIDEMEPPAATATMVPPVRTAPICAATACGNNAGCDGVLRYVCGYSDAGRAPMGDWDIDSCTYTKPDGSLPMQAAEVACIKLGGHLASVDSDADIEAVSAAGGDGAYICFHDIFSEVGCAGDGNSADDHDSGFIWTDGTFVDYTN